MPRPLEGIAVLFDLDGTLIDTAADLAASLNHTLKSAGLPPTPLDHVRHLVGHGARAMIEKGLADAGAPAATTPELDAHLGVFLAHYEHHLADQSRPFPGALDAVAAMRADGATIAICTNKREALACALIEELGLAGLFAAIHGPDTSGFAKPDPRPVRQCLAATGAARGVFVGDSDTDIRAAGAAGLPCLAALFGYGPLDLSAEAFALFSAYEEIPALVRRAAAFGLA
jgi:phosphoglycolate phosphatase